MAIGVRDRLSGVPPNQNSYHYAALNLLVPCLRILEKLLLKKLAVNQRSKKPQCLFGDFTPVCLRPSAWPASYYTRRLEDPKAVYVAPSGGDDTARLQKAINQVQESTGQGIVLLAPGQYHVSDTLYIWPSIRLIGYGDKRPVIVLPANAPGFGDASHEKVMIFFAGRRPR